MAGEPSLSEITSIQGDAAMGADGSNITEIRPNASLPYLQAASVAIAEADRQKNLEYQKNLQTALTRIDETDFTGLLDSDFKELRKGYAGLLKATAENFDVIRNPNRNIEKWAEIRQQEANLRTSLANAKDQKKIYDTSQAFLKANPLWNTEQNQSKLKSYLDSPRENRETFQFDQPFNADINALAKSVYDSSVVDSATSEITPDGRYFRDEQNRTYDNNLIKANLDAALTGQDTFGRNVTQGFQYLYDRLPETEKSKYTDVKDFITKNVLALRPKDVTTKANIAPNPIYLQNDQQAFTADQNERDRILTRRGQDLASGKAKINPVEAGAYKNELVTKFWETGQLPVDILQNIYGNNDPITVKQDILTADGEKTGETERKQPTSQVIASRIDENGNRIVDIRENGKNGKITRLTLTLDKINSDFNRVLGQENASKVADGSRQWLKGKTGSEAYNYDAVRPQFDVSGGQASSNVGYSNPRKINYNGKTVNAGVKNGKWYDIDSGKELK
jgi:hypothetical protein